MSLIDKIHHFYDSFRDSFSDIQIHMWLVLTIAIIFLLLHALRRLPIISNIKIIFGFIPTLVHELGHAIASTLTGGRVNDIHIVLTKHGQEKTSSMGYVDTQPRGWLSSIITLLFGYMMPPIIYGLGFYFVSTNQSFIFVGILFILGIYYLIKSRQKWIPIIILGLLVYLGYDLKFNDVSMISEVMFMGYSVILGLLLGEIVQSIIITAQTSFDSSDTSSDGKKLQEKTMIPKVIWFIIWLVIDIFAIWQSITLPI